MNRSRLRVNLPATILTLAVAMLGMVTLSAVEIAPVAEKVPPAVLDRQDFQVPDRVRLTGWIGQRIQGNEANRLVKLDAGRLLEGYRHRPGRQSWDGEHVGKWLHAATLAWANTGDPALREKLDYIAAELVKCQLDDGYLGTYAESNRWKSWDVWAHKYNLLGLLTYVRYTGNSAPLPACRRMADLLCQTFGEAPGKRDLIQAGPQVGMAPTSVLEPMVLLYRLTGEPRYLEFCKYILRAWEQPNGPKIISTLLATQRVDKIANGKAYEMISCLNGALEYYRTTGDPQILTACLNAWQDIVTHRLYLTGAASYWEIFHDDFDLPNNNIMGETCVTVTWLQFNAQLLRLTGEARFADQLENVVLNQLLGAQRCDGGAWGYYVQLEGRKPFTTNLDGQCCLSSGPRGIALIPTFATTTDAEGVVVNLYDSGIARLQLRDLTPVTLTIRTKYPFQDEIQLHVEPAAAKEFSVKLRIPAWCREAKLEVNGRKIPVTRNAAGYVVIARPWAKGDRIALRLKLAPRLIVGDHSNQGKAAVMYGPLVLAADEALLGKSTPARNRDVASVTESIPLNGIAVASSQLARVQVTPEPAPKEFRTWPNAQVFRMRAVTRKPLPGLRVGTPLSIRLVTFADAGTTGARYKVWLPLPRDLYAGNVLLDGQASHSRQRNLHSTPPSPLLRKERRGKGEEWSGSGEQIVSPDGSWNLTQPPMGEEGGREGGEGHLGAVTDEDFETFVTTADGKTAEEDWFAVQLEAPVMVKRVLFAHGKTQPDGGWFDTTAGKPRVQVRRTKAGEWETVAEITDYPATTMKNAAELEGGEHVTCTLARSIQIWAIRVVGKPAGGDQPQATSSSCAELQAFSE